MKLGLTVRQRQYKPDRVRNLLVQLWETRFPGPKAGQSPSWEKLGRQDQELRALLGPSCDTTCHRSSQGVGGEEVSRGLMTCLGLHPVAEDALGPSCSWL